LQKNVDPLQQNNAGKSPVDLALDFKDPFGWQDNSIIILFYNAIQKSKKQMPQKLQEWKVNYDKNQKSLDDAQKQRELKAQELEKNKLSDSDKDILKNNLGNVSGLTLEIVGPTNIKYLMQDDVINIVLQGLCNQDRQISSAYETYFNKIMKFLKENPTTPGAENFLNKKKYSVVYSTQNNPTETKAVLSINGIANILKLNNFTSITPVSASSSSGVSSSTSNSPAAAKPSSSGSSSKPASSSSSSSSQVNLPKQLTPIDDLSKSLEVLKNKLVQLARELKNRSDNPFIDTSF
jgi:hypothetical protein